MINVFYTCHQCGVQGARVLVEQRTPGEPLGSWMQKVGLAVRANHVKLSPSCLCRNVDLLVPAPDSKTVPVGEQAAEIERLGPKMAERMKSKGAN